MTGTRLQQAEARVEELAKGLEDLKTSMGDFRSELKADLRTMLADLLSTPASASHSAASPVDPAASSAAIPGAPPPPPIPAVPQSPVPQVEFPSFQGDNPSSWIARAEKYFRLHRVSDDARLDLALVAMDGSALNWFQWLLDSHPSISWQTFTTMLLKHFGDDPLTDPFEALGSLRQQESVGDYITAFITRVSHVRGLDPAVTLGLFLGGLRDEVRVRIRSCLATDLSTAMQLAREAEREINLGKVPREASTPAPSAPFARSFSPRPPMPPAATPARAPPRPAASSTSVGSTAPPRSRPTKWVPHADYVKRRAQGLCIYCSEPFSPLHKCKEQSFRLLILDNTETDDPSVEEGLATPLQEDTSPEPQAELSELAAGGFDAPQTMKIRGSISDCPVRIMVDSGATHCFISSHIVDKLHLVVDQRVRVSVRLGNGDRTVSCGMCPAVSLSLGGATFTVSCYVFPLGDIDLILGISWLAMLGDVQANWASLTMTFNLGGTSVHLRGDPSLARCEVSAHTLLKIADVEEQWVVWAGLDTSTTDQSAPVTPALPDSLRSLLLEFPTVMQPPQGLPPRRACDHHIPLLPGSAPVSVRPYRYSPTQKDEIERLVADILAAGIIQPSTGPYSSPVLLVKKKDGSWRFCVDYRELNKRTIPDKYPIPVIQELLDELHGATWFTRLDLRAGYHQIRIAESDIEKTGFRTHSGHYEFVVMPFGLMNAPSTFQAAMNDLLRPFLRRFVLVFFDDILIYSHSWEQHLAHLRERMIDYLGHVVSEDGVRMDPGKVSAVLQWPIPKSVKGVRGFLGLTGYYRRFIRDYGSIARPLTQLLKKDQSDKPFVWPADAQSSFVALRSAITSAPVLAMPDFSAPFVLECDASSHGLGAVLMQHRRPLAFFSKALSPRNAMKSTYEKELMALVLAVQHWRQYLMGRKFVVRTDHQSLRHFLAQPMQTPTQQYWVAKLLGFDFSIEYRRGASNLAADALSRRDAEVELSAVSIPQWLDWSALNRAVAADEVYGPIIRSLSAGQQVSQPYGLIHGVLFFKDRIAIPCPSPWIDRFLVEFHSTPTGGHAGAYRTYRRLAANVYWPKMMQSVREFVANCLVCQKNKYEARSPAGLLQPLPIPDRVWEDISMDFITGLPRSENTDCILVVVDRLSKYTHFLKLSHPFTARQVADLFAREIVRLHGVPRSIVSDRDPVFLSNFWQDLFRAVGTKLKMSSAYHPETDGQSEVMNCCLETYLRCFISEWPKSWAKWLSWAEYCFNTSFHTAAGTTPFEVVYGRPPPVLAQFLPGEVRVQSVAEELSGRDRILDQLREHLRRAQQRMIRAANQHRRDVTFSVGDKVFLKFRPYRQTTLFRKLNVKLAPRFFGPFEVEDRIGAAAYRLRLPPGSKIHPVFHVSQLKPVVGPHDVVSGGVPEFFFADSEFAPAAVRRRREVWRDNDRVGQLLVVWKGLGDDEATWVDELQFVQQFPDFRLEDKAVLDGKGVDIVYRRRAKRQAA